MRNEDKLKLAKKRKEQHGQELQQQLDKSEQETKERLEFHQRLEKSISDLADALQVNVDFPDIKPLMGKLDTLENLPDTFVDIKNMSLAINGKLAELNRHLGNKKQLISVRGFAEANMRWERIEKHVQKFADLDVWINQLTETLKQGQDPSDFRPVRIVVGGDGTPLDFLKAMPSSRGGGGISTESLNDSELAKEAKQDDIITNTKSEKDIFGHLIVIQQYNQIELRLDASDWADFVTETNANGGDTAQSGGMANLSTSTATNGSVILSSNDTVEYRPGVGIFGAGTAIFTAGVTGVNQYVGLGSDTSFANGVQFGYKGTSFGIRYMRGGSEVSFTAQADWDDPCLGATGSLFTRDGTLETLDPTKPNLYRIRAGLFGFAGWDAQVWSPDNGWITVLTYKHINTGSTPVFTSNTFKIVLSAVKTSGATDVTIKSQCWAAGTGSGLERLSSDLSDRKLAQTVRAVLAAKKPNGSYTNIEATAGGNLKLSLEEVDASVTVPVTTPNPTSLYENSTPILASGNVASGWLDVSTYTYITAVLYTDQNSATNGAKILLSSDGGTTTEKTLQNSITGGVGAYSYAIPTGAYDAVKFDFTNGGTNQTAFHIIIYGNKGANPVPVAPLGAGIDPTLSGLLTRAVLAAQNPAGTMSNLITTADGYLRNSIAQVEVDVPIKALTSLDIKQESIGTSSVQITAVATDRKTISLKARSSNTDLIFIGTSTAVTTSNGYELAAGDAVEFDVTEGQAIWAIGGAASQTLCVAEVS